MVYVTFLPHPKNALRRASGIWSLGGAGLFPEWCNVPGKVRSGLGEKGSTRPETNCRDDLRAETGAVRRPYLLPEGGVVLQIFPAVGDLAA